MTVPLCDASMQKEKKKKKKRKKDLGYQGWLGGRLMVSHIIIYWDNVGQHIFITTK
jgi:hypothetical protein